MQTDYIPITEPAELKRQINNLCGKVLKPIKLDLE